MRPDDRDGCRTCGTCAWLHWKPGAASSICPTAGDVGDGGKLLVRRGTPGCDLWVSPLRTEEALK